MPSASQILATRANSDANVLVKVKGSENRSLRVKRLKFSNDENLDPNVYFSKGIQHQKLRELKPRFLCKLPKDLRFLVVAYLTP